MKNLLYSVGLFILIASCVPQNTCYRKYKFSFPAALYPALDTFSVGDTIWYEMNVNNQLEDQETGDIIDMSDFELYYEFGATRYDTIDYNDALSNFTFHAIEGNLNLTSSIGYVSFDNVNNKKFKMAFVPQKKGGHVFSVSLGFNLVFEEVELGDECIEDIKNDSRVVIETNTDNNVEVLEDLFLINNVGDTLYWMQEDTNIEDLKHYYVFYVR